jgi:hypothetical protein
MHVSYSVLPSAKSVREPQVHWLISIAEGLRYADKSNDELFVKMDRTQNWVTYLMRSQRTKVTAQMHGKGSQIYISILHQQDVDPSDIVVPRGVAIAAEVFHMRSNGIRHAVDFLLKHFTSETIYSNASNQRIQIGLQPQPDNAPPIFFGGLVAGTGLDFDSMVDEKGGTLRNAVVRVSDMDKEVDIRVGTMNIGFHPDNYKPFSCALASKSTGEVHNRVYTFSRASLETYYALKRA